MSKALGRFARRTVLRRAFPHYAEPLNPSEGCEDEEEHLHSEGAPGSKPERFDSGAELTHEHAGREDEERPVGEFAAIGGKPHPRGHLTGHHHVENEAKVTHPCSPSRAPFVPLPTLYKARIPKVR